MKKKFLAKFKIVRQVSPEDWVYVYTEKLFPEEATLKDLKNWMKKEEKIKEQNDYRIENLELTEPEQ